MVRQSICVRAGNKTSQGKSASVREEKRATDFSYAASTISNILLLDIPGAGGNVYGPLNKHTLLDRFRFALGVAEGVDVC